MVTSLLSSTPSLLSPLVTDLSDPLPPPPGDIIFERHLKENYICRQFLISRLRNIKIDNKKLLNVKNRYRNFEQSSDCLPPIKESSIEDIPPHVSHQHSGDISEKCPHVTDEDTVQSVDTCLAKKSSLEVSNTRKVRFSGNSLNAIFSTPACSNQL